MKLQKNIFALLLLLNCVLITIPCSSQNEERNYIELYGEILNNERSDITVFREVENDWKIVRTMKSRSKYKLELNLSYNHYVIFNRRDGLKKAIYVNKTSPGYWKMNYDVTFYDFSTDYTVIYKNDSSNSFSYKVYKKRNQKIKIYNYQNQELVIAN